MKPRPIKYFIIPDTYDKDTVRDMEKSIIFKLGFFLNPVTLDEVLLSQIQKLDDYLGGNIDNPLSVERFYRETQYPVVDPEIILAANKPYRFASRIVDLVVMDSKFL